MGRLTQQNDEKYKQRIWDILGHFGTTRGARGGVNAMRVGRSNPLTKAQPRGQAFALRRSEFSMAGRPMG
jgi:hypothetical protein